MSQDVAATWLDIDTGVCQSCSVDRRMYTPLADRSVKVCANCAYRWQAAQLLTKERLDAERPVDKPIRKRRIKLVPLIPKRGPWFIRRSESEKSGEEEALK